MSLIHLYTQFVLYCTIMLCKYIHINFVFVVVIHMHSASEEAEVKARMEQEEMGLKRELDTL